MRSLESIAAADGAHFQMQRSVFGMAALIEQRVRGFLRFSDLHEIAGVRSFMMFAKVKAKSALSVM